MNAATRKTIEDELRQYAHDLIADHVLEEYKLQISKWQRAINEIADAQKDAFNSFKATLKKSHANTHVSDDVAMFALGLVGGVALSWLSARIQYKLIPKYMTKMSSGGRGEWRTVYNSHIRKALGGKTFFDDRRMALWISDPDSYDKVAAKIFGDLANNVVLSPLVDGAVASLAPKQVPEEVDEAVTGPRSTFKTSLENALLAQSETVQKQIMGLALKIRHTDAFGKDWLKRGGDNEKAAKKAIREHLNIVRRAWAKKWFYFGQDPLLMKHGQMTNTLEREMWAVWIVGELVDLKKGEGRHFTWRMKNGRRRGTDISFLDEPFIDSSILKRLRKVNAVQTRQETRFVQFGPERHEARLKAKRVVTMYDDYKRLHTWAVKHPPAIVNLQPPGLLRIIPDIMKIHS